METKITEASLKEKISNVEYLKFISTSGQILRWAVLTMANGFAVTGKPSAAVDPVNDDEEMGQKIALENAMNEAWVLEGYALKERLCRVTSASKDQKVAALQGLNINPVPKPTTGLTFGQAIEYLKMGSELARAGWNGKGIFIALQTPDANSFMTTPYIYIDSTQLQTDNPAAVLNRVPWLASQTDILASDWCIV